MNIPPSLTTISYNGWEFPAESHTEGVSVRPVYDSAGRTVKYNVYSFTIRVMIAGGPTSEIVQSARRRLTKPGAAFQFSGVGMDMAINVTGVRDVVWGPKPQELSFRPLGGGNACELVWHVETAIPDCKNAQYRFAAMEYAYTATFQTDRAGYTTRTITGHLTIPNNRAGVEGRKLTDSPDQYREQVVPQLLPGFRRVYGPFTISEDRTRLDFSVSDEEMKGKNIPPPYVTDIRASAVVSSSQKGLAQWAGTISAEYEISPDAPDAYIPWRHFFEVLVKDRVEATRKKLGKHAKGIVPVAMSLSEPEIYGARKSSFSFTFTFHSGIKDIFEASGLWRPVPGSDWKRWATSLRMSALDPRGFANLELTVDDDSIVDLCMSRYSEMSTKPPHEGELRGGGGPELLRPTRDQSPRPYEAAKALEAIAPTPKPAESWLFYETELWLEMDDGAASVRLLPIEQLTAKDDAISQMGANSAGAFDAFMDTARGFDNGVLGTATKSLFNLATFGVFDTGGTGGSGVPGGLGGGRLENNPNGANTASVGRRVRSAAYIYLRGRAARHGYPIPIPKLTDLNGMAPVPANRLDRGEGFGQGIKYGAGKTGIYQARWNLRYALPGVPDKPLPTPPNPMLDPASDPES